MLAIAYIRVWHFVVDMFDGSTLQKLCSILLQWNCFSFVMVVKPPMPIRYSMYAYGVQTNLSQSLRQEKQMQEASTTGGKWYNSVLHFEISSGGGRERWGFMRPGGDKPGCKILVLGLIKFQGERGEQMSPVHPPKFTLATTTSHYTASCLDLFSDKMNRWNIVCY